MLRRYSPGRDTFAVYFLPTLSLQLSAGVRVQGFDVILGAFTYTPKGDCSAEKNPVLVNMPALPMYALFSLRSALKRRLYSSLLAFESNSSTDRGIFFSHAHTFCFSSITCGMREPPTGYTLSATIMGRMICARLAKVSRCNSR